MVWQGDFWIWLKCNGYDQKLDIWTIWNTIKFQKKKIYFFFLFVCLQMCLGTIFSEENIWAIYIAFIWMHLIHCQSIQFLFGILKYISLTKEILTTWCMWVMEPFLPKLWEDNFHFIDPTSSTCECCSLHVWCYMLRVSIQHSPSVPPIVFPFTPFIHTLACCQNFLTDPKDRNAKP